MGKSYPFKFNEPVDVDFEYEKQVPVMSDDKRGVTMRTEKITTSIKTIYTKIKKNKIACNKGEHEWIMADRHKYIAKCLNNGCLKRRNLNPLIHTIKDGHLLNRTTKELID